ncbi:MAG TPA: hypothetical protein VF884_10735 [Nitrososphaeraceae archaeon]
MDAKLRLKLKPEVTKQAEDTAAVTELLSRCLGGGYVSPPPPRPKLRLGPNQKVMGGSCQITQYVRELLELTIV